VIKIVNRTGVGDDTVVLDEFGNNLNSVIGITEIELTKITPRESVVAKLTVAPVMIDINVAEVRYADKMWSLWGIINGDRRTSRLIARAKKKYEIEVLNKKATRNYIETTRDCEGCI